MAEVAQFAAIVLAMATDRGAAPVDFSGRRGRKPAENAQQAGFAGPVGPLQIEQFAALEAKSDAGEKSAFATHASQPGGFQGAWGGRVDRCFHKQGRVYSISGSLLGLIGHRPSKPVRRGWGNESTASGSALATNRNAIARLGEIECAPLFS